MIDFSNEIFTAVADHIRFLYPGIQVKGENVDVPAKFPCVAMDETQNVPVYLDSARFNKYARIQIRVQVFSNSENGKRSEARKIYKDLDEKMMELGLFCATYTTLPAIYNSEIYSITATYEAVIGHDGVIYRR